MRSATLEPAPAKQARRRRRARGGIVPLLSLLGVGSAVVIALLSALAPLIAPADPTVIDLRNALLPPSLAHPLGTDHLGRDLLSRVLWAGRTSLTVATLVIGSSLAVGLVVGCVAGFVGGVGDRVGMLLADTCLALPTLLLALALIGAVGPSVPALVIALTAGWWAPYARLARSQVRVLRGSAYVEAAEAIGVTRWYLIRRHIMPGVIGPLAVQGSLDVGAVLLAIGSLSFLGLGVQPPDPEWGTMLVEARPFLETAPHLMLAPGLALFLTVLGCNALGELLARRGRPEP
jgi:ABC-type dipeptide/oligopeptide/nickel transport system permease subunit